MKILLIDPPFYRFIKYFNRFFPLGLTCLAAQLRSEGHEVIIYDADANVDKNEEMDFSMLETKYPDYLNCINNLNHPIWGEARNIIKQIKPDVVGISVFTTKAAAAFRIAQIVKEIDDSIHVVIGGPHPSVKAEESLKISSFIDFAIRGEGEKSFPSLIQAIEKKASYCNVKGLSYKENGKIYHNPPVDLIEDLDTIPLPARDLLLNKDSYTSEDMGLMLTGRGCPYSCSFCSSNGVWSRMTRQRSINNVLQEIKQIKAKYKTTQFSFKDDTFTVNRNRVLRFCEEIKKNDLKIKWDCNVRVNLVDQSLLKTMKESGCNGIKMGIESGSERVLSDIMKKGTTLDQIKNAAKAARKTGLYWTGYFMMGLPGETPEEMKQTLELLKSTKPDFASLSVFEPFPGTELYDNGVAAGYLQDSMALKDYYEIIPKHYYIKKMDKRLNTMPINEFNRVERAMKASFHKYNRSVFRLLKKAKTRSSLYVNNPGLLLSDSRKFLAWIK